EAGGPGGSAPGWCEQDDAVAAQPERLGGLVRPGLPWPERRGAGYACGGQDRGGSVAPDRALSAPAQADGGSRRLHGGSRGEERQGSGRGPGSESREQRSGLRRGPGAVGGEAESCSEEWAAGKNRPAAFAVSGRLLCSIRIQKRSEWLIR